MMLSCCAPALLLVLGLSSPISAQTAGPVGGPVIATVIAVYDGDTLVVEARPWPQLILSTRVRIDRVDAPEIRGKCPQEKIMAKAAKARVTELAGDAVILRNIRLGKYAGRVVAEVYTRAGRNIAEVLVSEKLARPYAGGARLGWCA